MKYKLFFYLAILLTLNSCSKAIIAPKQYHPQRKMLQYIPHGHWMNIDYQLNNEKVIYGGELIAIESDTIYLLDLQSKLHKIPTASINRGNLVLHQSDANRYARQTLAGFYASVPATGFFIIFTGPAWLITGISASIGANKSGYFLETSTHSWEEIAIYARFPRGIPPEVNLTKLEAIEFGTKYRVK